MDKRLFDIAPESLKSLMEQLASVEHEKFLLSQKVTEVEFIMTLRNLALLNNVVLTCLTAAHEKRDETYALIDLLKKHCDDLCEGTQERVKQIFSAKTKQETND